MFTINARAAKVVHRNSLNPADKWDLLRALGLVDHLGNLLPDDEREYEIEVNEVTSGQRIGQRTEHLMTVRPAESTAPEGLRNLPEPAAQPITERASKPKPAPKPQPKPAAKTGLGRGHRHPDKLVHGTSWGYKRHKQNGEDPKDVCTPCYEAKRVEWQATERRRNRPSRARALRPCGTISAARRHRDYGESLCEPCKQAERDDYKQRYWAKKGQTA